MTTKYRVYEKSTGDTVAFIYLGPDPNLPTQMIIGSITPVANESTPTMTGRVTKIAKNHFFKIKTPEREIIKALLNSIEVTADDSEHRFEYEKSPA